MAVLTYQKTIAAAPEVVFEFLADLRNETLWREGMSRSDVRDGVPGTAGATYEQQMASPMGNAADVVTVLQAEEPGLVQVRNSGRPMLLQTTYRLSPEAGSTTRLDIEVTLPSGPMATLAKRMIDKQFAENLPALERQLTTERASG